MAFVVTGEPRQAMLESMAARLRAHAELMAILTAVYGHVTEASRAVLPYGVFGRTSVSRNAGAMQMPGSMVSVEVDFWSGYKGPYEMNRILSLVSTLFERQRVLVSGFTVVEGSMTCEMSEVFDEPDEDKPSLRLYHGVQRWQAEIHEAT